jgi:stage V sporulation protein SpoVS
VKPERYLQLTKHYGSVDGTVAGIADKADRAKCKAMIAEEQSAALNPVAIYRRFNNPPSVDR